MCQNKSFRSLTVISLPSCLSGNKLAELLCIFLLTCTGTFAQRNEIIFTRISREEGLAVSKINCMIKDSRGYYWLSSVGGLQRYDGHRMVTFRNEPGNDLSLPDNNVGCLMEDRKQRLWLNAGGYPCLYDPSHRSFRKISVEKEGKQTLSISSFFQDSKGTIWMIASLDGLFVLDTVNNAFRPYTSRWPAFFSSANTIAEDTVTGCYWITTGAGDIIVFDSKTKNYHTYEKHGEQFNCLSNPEFSRAKGIIYLDKNRVLWTHGWSSAAKGFVSYRYDIQKNQLRKVNNTGPQFWGFLTDQTGLTWGYGAFLGKYDEHTNTFVEVPKTRNSLFGIDYNGINNMYEDAAGNFWVMTDMGVYRFNLKRQYFSTINNMWSNFYGKNTDAFSNGFIETSDGHIIALGWNGDGLLFFDSLFNQAAPMYGYNPNWFKEDVNFRMTWCGLQDSHGFIWIGAQHSRIIRIDPVKKRVESYVPKEFGEHTIRSMAEDKYGNIWFGSQRGVLVKWERTTGKFVQVLSEKNGGTPLNHILSIVCGNKNDLWIGTSTAGLLHLDIASGKIIRSFQHDERNPGSIGSYAVHAIEKLSGDTLAIATNKGIDLFHISMESFTHITVNDGLPDGGLISMVADRERNLWFTSVNGIAKIDLRTKNVTEFGTRDGIAESEFQLRSSIRLKDGRIIFGSTRSIVYFTPEKVNELDPPSDVAITGFRLFNRSLSVDSLFANRPEIRLSYNQNYISIQFASLKNAAYDRVQYYYKLDGINQDWVATQNPEVIYTYLPPGKYTFSVKAESAGGAVSAQITSFRILIEPPYYKTWWFYTILAIIISAIAVFIYRQRINKLLAVEKLRARVARDLHDDMGSTLSTINILSSMAKTRMAEDPKKTSEYISRISDNSQRMMEAMDDIVWAIRPDNDNMQKITARMREFATGILEAKDIELDFTVDEKVNDVKLNMEDRRDFFLIFKEAVNNVAKYSRCSKCIIRISFVQKRLLLTVADNGIGFEVGEVDSGNGLSNMQKRAEALRGRASVQSAPGNGTNVTVNIPVR